VLEQAIAAAAGHLVTVGIRPSRPETGYGYLELGSAADGVAREVRRFVEKPDRARAEQYLADGNYLWNSGMFVFTAETMLQELQTYAPDVLSAVRRALAVGKDIDYVMVEGPAQYGPEGATERFILADVLATQAGVEHRGERGWAMRLGDDTAATLAAAICDAEAASAATCRAQLVRVKTLRPTTATAAALSNEWATIRAMYVFMATHLALARVVVAAGGDATGATPAVRAGFTPACAAALCAARADRTCAT